MAPEPMPSTWTELPRPLGTWLTPRRRIASSSLAVMQRVAIGHDLQQRRGHGHRARVAILDPERLLDREPRADRAGDDQVRHQVGLLGLDHRERARDRRRVPLLRDPHLVRPSAQGKPSVSGGNAAGESSTGTIRVDSETSSAW